MVVSVTRSLCRFWPWTSSSKQVLMLHELEDVLEMCGAESLSPLALRDIARVLARCVDTPHFQVCERALAMWQNETLCRGLLGGPPFAAIILPPLFPALSAQAFGHWNPSVESLAKSVLGHYEKVAREDYLKCVDSLQEASGGGGGGGGGGKGAKGANSRRWDALDRSGFIE